MKTFVKEHFGMMLDDNPLWEKVAIHVVVRDKNIVRFIETFVREYQIMLYNNPELVNIIDPLFFNILQSDNVIQGSNRREPKMGPLLYAWTQYGTYDIPDIYVERLVPLIKKQLMAKDYDGDVENKIFKHNQILDLTNVAMSSRKIWSALEKEFSMLDSHIYYKDAYAQLLFRYAASINDIDTSTQTYEYQRLCEGIYNGTPDLMSMTRVLTGPHNNALAWHTALAVCAPEDPTIAGSWMKMSETFSALRLDPKDQDAWRFWHLLSECTKDDASGQELLSCLAETKHEMASAFADAWSIVDALEEGDARYACAAQLQHSPISALNVPETVNMS